MNFSTRDLKKLGRGASADEGTQTPPQEGNSAVVLNLQCQHRTSDDGEDS